MGTGYVRNDTANNIADSNVIDAADLDGEFDALVSAFNSAAGHTHDGTAAEGGAITVFGPVQDFIGGSGDFSPKTGSAYDLGKTAVRWATGYLDDLVLTTALPVAQGGTGATSTGAARTALGVGIGTNVQAYDAQLDDIAALAVTDGNIIVGDGSTWVAESGSAARTSLGLAIGSDVQAYDSVLDNTTASYTSAEETKLSGIEANADVTDVTNVTAAGALMDSEVDADLKTFALPANTTISAFGKTLVDDANAAAALITLGVSSTAAELNYVDGVTSSIQTQLNLSAGASSSALGVLNVSSAALERFDLTAQGTGAGNVIQGFASDPYTGELFTLHVSGDPETSILNKFEADGRRTQTSVRWNSTATNTVGHQELDISWDKDGERWLWTAENYAAETHATRYIKRFKVADGAGTELTISDQQQFQVWGDDVTGDSSSTVAVSLDGKYLVTEHTGAGNTNRIRVFDLPAMMLGGAGDYSTAHLIEWTVDLNTTTYPLQSLACDGSAVYIFAGNIATGPTLKVFVYTMAGALIQEIDDFTVGESAARADDTGTDAYEFEGAGWIWHGGTARLAISIASGDAGSRKNRIWVLGAGLPITGYGGGNVPSFISQGGNDFATPDGEVLRLGHYNQTTDTFTEAASFATDGELTFKGKSGTWTPVISDAATGGNIGSATVADATYVDLGGILHVKFKLTNIDTSGMTGANNLYIQGLPTAAATDSDGIISYSHFTPDGSGMGLVPSVDKGTTVLFIKEMISGGVYINANVSQFASGTADIWITMFYPT